ncbi:conserved Plasmodium protein, unknown function [Plasmodium berghei]|uniref:Uncharacterized protein n=2 Tax=Plasmodium berghei TaxID=5821 RepID=A0A509AHR6_PLABA|nr:conserved Plasmodium protein, unknown function [Plasmodium berghei ANKA]CXI24510.1 conserved Plasmodium protein, unknown function [Plasmodium berghei]SCM20299.1 conserved Plasmodium protein, unknown function [Plasmodium berghei]SCN23911.1 conserved Plasmodium protein, unknown function [Plasmodium berghei]SCO59300.1 conserved Plasmodium protein, unknown function [Plasmodium berghei]SCO60333.1 conserved Plasmodium protein, unknown function [Plasmodium berghei]|eukprot:XP_034420839.1 conserved Plasmodium protein, unknown function [Plasmodium berghei ANKA]
MTKVNKPPTTSNPNIKLKKPSSKEEEFYQPVKKTVITKTPNKVPSKKTDENIISPQKKIENESTNSNEKDANKKDVTPNIPDKTKVNSDKKNKDNNAASQPGIFSWLWRYFPKKKT